MRTSAAGSKRRSGLANGFTLLELLVVVVLIAVATAGVSLSLRDSADSALERDAERLAVLLETGRAQARANGVPVLWRTQTSTNGQEQTQGFVFDGLPPPGLPRAWLSASTRALPKQPVLLGPEPLIPPQAIAMTQTGNPSRTLWVVTDGLRPFKVQSSPAAAEGR